MTDTKKCYEQLITDNEKFKGAFLYNFEKPVIFNDTKYQDALLGNLIISVRNSIGKFQSKYLIYNEDGINFIDIKVSDNDKSCTLSIELTEEERLLVNSSSKSIIMQFDTFLKLLNDNRFYLE